MIKQPEQISYKEAIQMIKKKQKICFVSVGTKQYQLNHDTISLHIQKYDYKEAKIKS